MLRLTLNTIETLSRRINRRQKSILLSFAAAALLNILIGSIIFFLYPGCEDYLRKEDSLIENITVAVYLGTFTIALFLARKRAADRCMLITLCILAAIAALEELSYGQRIFGYEAIASYRHETFDSIHDLFKIGYLLLRNYFYPHKWAAAIFLTCGGMLAVLLKIRLNLHIPAALSPRWYPALYLAGFAGSGMLFCALLFDVARFNYPYLFILEELLELNGAMALLTATLCANGTAPDHPNANTAALHNDLPEAGH